MKCLLVDAMPPPTLPPSTKSSAVGAAVIPTVTSPRYKPFLSRFFLEHFFTLASVHVKSCLRIKFKLFN